MDTQTVPAATDIEERTLYVQALRDLADFLETHEDVPVDDNDTLGPWLAYGGEKITPQRAAELAGALDAVVVRDGVFVKLCRSFGPLTYRVALYASDVCEEREELTKVSVLPEALARRERS